MDVNSVLLAIGLALLAYLAVRVACEKSPAPQLPTAFIGLTALALLTRPTGPPSVG